MPFIFGSPIKLFQCSFLNYRHKCQSICVLYKGNKISPILCPKKCKTNFYYFKIFFWAVTVLSLIVASSQPTKHQAARSSTYVPLLQPVFCWASSSASYRCNTYRMPALSFVQFYLLLFPLNKQKIHKKETFQ